MTRPEPLLEVRSLVTQYVMPHGTITATNNVSFSVARGEIVGLVGESGSGKSVTARSLLRLVGGRGRIVGGEVIFDGVDLLKLPSSDMRAVRGRRMALVAQDAMVALNPLIRVGQQIVEVLQVHEGLSRKAARQRAVELLELTGIPDPRRAASAFPNEFSGGMLQRVVIAMALSCNPQLLIADEPTTALDATISEQVMQVLLRLRRELDVAVILITHDLGLVAGVADRVNIMYAGRIVEEGPVRDIFANPRHHYTRGLLASMPRIDQDRSQRLVPIEGRPPVLHALPPGCSFAPRCAARLEKCGHDRPELVRVGDEHIAACWDLAPPTDAAVSRMSRLSADDASLLREGSMP